MPSSPISGLISGIDSNSLIDQLLSLERRPVNQLVAKRSTFEAKISAFGSIKSTLSSLQDSLDNLKSSAIYSLNADSSDPAVLTVSADSNAVEGDYQVVVSSIATAQTLYSNTFSNASAEVADLSVVTSQTLRVQVGNGTYTDITIDATNNSLTGIKDAINNASLGITATTVDTGFTVDGTNNVLMFNDGSDRTATLGAGNYTKATMAAEIKRALEEANGGSDTYTVSYDDASQTFKIANDSSNSNSIDLLFEHASTTAEGLLGFDATDHAAVAVGSDISSDNAVGGYRLFLTSDTTGTAGRISIQVDEDADGIFEESTSETDTTGLSVLAFSPDYDSNGAILSGTNNLTQSQAAQNAQLVYEGLTITRDSNTITDLIEGVTINLLADSAGETIDVNVDKNTAEINSNLEAFAGAYNSAVGLIRSLSVPVDGQSVLLGGDGTARGILNSLRQAVTSSYEGQSLAALGLSHDLTSTLSIDATILDAAVTDDLDGVVATIDSMADALDRTLSDYILTAIPAKSDGMETSIDQIDNRIQNLDRRLVIVEASLRRKFLGLESLLSQFEQSSNFLNGALANLPKPNSVGGKSS